MAGAASDAASDASNPLAAAAVPIAVKAETTARKQASVKKLQEAVDADPDDIDSWGQLLRSLRSQPELARQAYTTFLKRFPTAVSRPIVVCWIGCPRAQGIFARLAAELWISSPPLAAIPLFGVVARANRVCRPLLPVFDCVVHACSRMLFSITQRWNSQLAKSPTPRLSWESLCGTRLIRSCGNSMSTLFARHVSWSP